MIEKDSTVIPHRRVWWEMGEKPEYRSEIWQGLCVSRSLESPMSVT